MKNRSTSTNLLSFHHFISDILKDYGQVDCVYTDFSKAFDKVNHNLLINKLSAFGVHGNILKWLFSFLTGRRQIVRIDGCDSEPTFIPSGCIQGGHGSSLLFSLFINDIISIFPNIKFWLFADDLKFAMRVDGPAEAEIIQSVLLHLRSWCSSNFMELNVSKCSVVSFYRNKSPYIANYQIDGQVLTRQSAIRDLGVVFEKDLTFISHINHIRSKALKMLGFLYRNTQDFLNPATLRTLYFAYVRSGLDYASIIWSPYYACHITTLERVQHKFLRMLAYKSGSRVDDHNYEPIQQKFNIIDLESRRQLNDLIFFKKIIDGNIFLPELLNDIQFRSNSRYSSHNKRRLFYVKVCKTNIHKYSPFNRFQILWNALSDEDVELDIFSESEAILRKKAKKQKFLPLKI
ncbi:hypothetical protein WDU94_000586 [Cyamophila willieti]